MQRLLALLLVSFFCAAPSFASDSTAKIKVVDFTATWCPYCPGFERKLSQAMTKLNDPEIMLVTMDMTPAQPRVTSQADVNRFYEEDLRSEMVAKGVSSIYTGYSRYGATAFAVVVAADTQEILFCTSNASNAETIEKNLSAAKTRVEYRAPGQRVPEGPDCPPMFVQ